MITHGKWDKLKQWMEALRIHESDLTEKFIVGSGRGGQNLHKTASTVYLKHTPSGIEIKCQYARSQEANRYYARIRLCKKLDAEIHGEKSAEQQAREKIRRQKRRRSKRAKEKILVDKARKSHLKQLRRSPGVEP